MSSDWEPGQLLASVEIGPVAHGGHFVGRHDGRVVFVRHTLTGELVDVRLTEVSKRFARGDAVTIHRASPHRVTPPCPIAGRCGGCDFQHVEPAHTRELKRQVVAELLGHLAGYEFTGDVAEVPPSPLGWRTRMRYLLDTNGVPGMRAHRSSEVVPLPEGGCRIADPAIAQPPSDRDWAGSEVLGVVSADEGFFGIVGTDVGTAREHVGDLSFEVAADGFWQAHASAPEVLVDRVLAGLAPQVGETALDLYCGVGLFAGALAAAGVTVWGVEGDSRAVELARENVPGAKFFVGDVARRFDRVPKRVSLVVLDPPRDGAGAQVLGAVARLHPRAIAYVACDPAALGRDLKTAAGLGYRPTSVTAHDLFPLTHHVECVAILEHA
jgi:tRNA/tmRNA/rRNA uracil-C5-methylase (TrmA/RlmC/RlmD family)